MKKLTNKPRGPVHIKPEELGNERGKSPSYFNLEKPESDAQIPFIANRRIENETIRDILAVMDSGKPKDKKRTVINSPQLLGGLGDELPKGVQLPNIAKQGTNNKLIKNGKNHDNMRLNTMNRSNEKLSNLNNEDDLLNKEIVPSNIRPMRPNIGIGKLPTEVGKVQRSKTEAKLPFKKIGEDHRLSPDGIHSIERLTHFSHVRDKIINTPTRGLYSYLKSNSLSVSNANLIRKFIVTHLNDGFVSLKQITPNETAFLHVRNAMIMYAVEKYYYEDKILCKSMTIEGNKKDDFGVQNLKLGIGTSIFYMIVRNDEGNLTLSEPLCISANKYAKIKMIFNQKSDFDDYFKLIGAGASSYVYEISSEVVLILSRLIPGYTVPLHVYLDYENLILPIHLFSDNDVQISIARRVTPLTSYQKKSYSDRSAKYIDIASRVEVLKTSTSLAEEGLPQSDIKIDNLGYLYTIVDGKKVRKLVLFDLTTVSVTNNKLDSIYTPNYQTLFSVYFNSLANDSASDVNTAALLHFKVAQIFTLILWACGRTSDDLYKNGHMKDKDFYIGTLHYQYSEINNDTLVTIAEKLFKEEFIQPLLYFFGEEQIMRMNKDYYLEKFKKYLTIFLDTDILDMIQEGILESTSLRFTQKEFYILTGINKKVV